MLTASLIVGVLALLGLAGWLVYRNIRTHKCGACGTPLPGPGYCSRECSIQVRTRQINAGKDR